MRASQRFRACGRALSHRYRVERLVPAPVARALYRTVWAPPGHYYSPYADPREVAAQRSNLDDRVPFGVDLAEDSQRALLTKLATLVTEWPPAVPTSGWRYHLDNVPFAWGDGLTLWAMLHSARPRRVVEVGSGWSTRLLLDARDRVLPELELTVVDPHARLAPSDAASVVLHREPVQRVDPACFAELEAGDVCFIDSSHVAKPGSDVTHLWFDVVPKLAPGVIVHVHDVHWPFEPPQAWVERGCAWNEPYLVRALLVGGRVLQIRLWNSFLARAHSDALRATLPGIERNVGASLWLQRLNPVALPAGR